MTSILGLDISSVQLNGCLLTPGQPPILRSERLGKPTDPLIERLRRVPGATDTLTWTHWRTTPDWLVIEDAFGRNRNADRALNRVIGAIIASCPRETQIATLSSGDWRRALGVANKKLSGHGAVGQWLFDNGYLYDGEHNYDEHELDAIGIALAWQSILAQQDAA